MKAARVSKGKILLVDDDPAVQRGLSALLLAANYDVEIFGSGDDFLAKRDNSLTAGAAMLVDVYMPGVQGLELLERLKKEGYSDADARLLIAQCVAAEMFNVMKHNEPYNSKRYVSNLNALPEPPSE